MPSAFDLFCEENYVARWREACAAEEERRSEAFFDVARPVAGLALRPLTPADLHVLDSYRSPFVCGDPAEATAEHIISVLWLLRYVRPRYFAGLVFRLHRAAILRRWRRAPELLTSDHADLSLWFDATFADSGAPRTAPEDGQPAARAPIGAHFLASLLVPLCQELGPVDPATGRPLIETPLARLFQYQKILRIKREGESFVDFNAADRIKGEALEAWNDLTPAERAVWQARVTPATGEDPTAP
jgi:hypothetical protein